MPYKINGVILLTQPTAGQWTSRETLGVDGNGHAVYPSLREFELTWDLVDLDTSNQLQNFYNGIDNTGTVSVDLPLFNDVGATGTFQTYSGCILREPEFEQYFEYYRENAKLLIVRIRT